ncbi:MAG: hypothetical protein ACAI25_15560 [Planctomycetota bacterium]
MSTQPQDRLGRGAALLALLVLLLALPSFLAQRGPATEAGSSAQDSRAALAKTRPLRAPAAVSSASAAPGCTSSASASLRGEVPDDDDDAGEGADSTSRKLSSELLAGADAPAVDDSPTSLRRPEATPIRAPPLV